MKSNFYTIVGLIGLFFFSLPIRLFAATEYNPDAIHVDSLPVCDQSIVNNVYALSTDNHYWKCNLIPGGLRNIQVGDVLKDKVLYFSFPDEIRSDSYYVFGNTNNRYYVFSSDPNWDMNSLYDSNDKAQIYVTAVNNGNFTIMLGGTNTNRVNLYLYVNRNLSTNISQYDLSSNFNVNNLFSNPIAKIDFNNPAYQYIKISLDDRYEYVDQGEIPVLYTYDDKDFYLFYDFGMIANLDIFSNYDFTSFTDYQKVVVVIGFNVFYIAILCFFGAILYKTIARIIRFILG